MFCIIFLKEKQFFNENLAKKYDISREDQELFAIESHKKANSARESGNLTEEIIPMKISGISNISIIIITSILAIILGIVFVYNNFHTASLLRI